ncbi:conjugal transfer protein TraF [Aquabacterium humicola]|uniref:conjugal transfer protein TraF n=1 Tax=Aquabacterium humicola TaxID=3237377 RepID=UPI0025438C82|nr:conjugal transfer protein TraF [Rubrivivax pictus]
MKRQDPPRPKGRLQAGLRQRRLVVLLLAALSTLAAPAQDLDSSRAYWQDAWRGWHFYEEPEAKPLAPARPTPRQPKPGARVPSHENKPPEVRELERLQRELDEARSVAIIRPTESNVRRYMAIEARVVSQASTFADVAQRIAWSDPELDPTLQGRPVNARALEVFEQAQAAERSRQVASLGRDHVLLFFFRSDCSYCHAFAPTLEAFSAKHGLKVIAVTIDGGTLPGFEDARRDNGIATTLRVGQVPAVYLAQPYSGLITPIGFGVLSEAQLIERIATVASPPPAAPLDSPTLASATGRSR